MRVSLPSLAPYYIRYARKANSESRLAESAAKVIIS